MQPKAECLTPGTFVRCPANPGWGLGQVQSVVAGRATVNFENCGKLVLRLEAVPLAVVDAADAGSEPPVAGRGRR